MCRHRHADLLFDEVEVPPVPDGLIQPYPDLGHAVDGEAARRYASFVPNAAIEANIALGTPGRDEATWTGRTR